MPTGCGVIWGGAVSTPRFSTSWRSGSNNGRWRDFRWLKWRYALNNCCWAGKWCCHARRCSPACYSRFAGAPKGRCFASIAEQLPSGFRKEIDRMLEVPESAHRSDLFHLKAYPPEGKPDTILSFLANYRYLHSIGVAEIRLAGCTVALLLQFSKTARREDVWHLRRLPEAKRYALTACFLVEALKITLDHAVEMNDQFLGGMCRRSKNSFERKQKEYRQRARQGRQQLLRGMEIVVEGDRQPVEMYLHLYAQIPKLELRSAMADCCESDRLEVHGYADELNARVSHLKRYQPRFFELPFEARPGSETMLTALGVARRLDSGELKALPSEAPVDFVASNLRASLRSADGSPKQRTWEIALGLAVRDKLRSGDLYLAESRKHGQFWNLVYEDSRWNAEREQGSHAFPCPRRLSPYCSTWSSNWTAWPGKRGKACPPIRSLRSTTGDSS